MKKLFIDYTPGDEITLDDEQSRHIAGSLRMKAGDFITVTDGSGSDYGCMIETVDKDCVKLKVCYKKANESEADCKVTVYQGVPKGSKLEDIIQKCTELGAVKFVPVLTKRCISRPDEKSAKKKKQRYEKIALEAAQQSGRGAVPEVDNIKTLKEALAQDESEVKIVFYEGGGKPVSEIIDKDTKSVSIYIGPEGGFEKDEVDLILNSGGKCATLGPRILRTQTAPVAALTSIMLLTGNLE